MFRPGLLLAALLLAGCSVEDPAAPTPATPGGTPAAAAFGEAVALPIACRYSCYEPSVARDGAGRLVVSDGVTADLAVSLDGGVTWAPVASPPMPGPGPGFQTDVLVQASPSGRLYYSALLFRTLPGNGGVLEGLQVAWSEDGGQTWPVNVHLSLLTDPTAGVYSPDRQWLGFGEGETVYLTYNQIPTGIWIARSDDGGKTWGGWTRAAPLEGRMGGIGQSGPPLVDAEGRVLVPACSLADESVRVFVSEDGGRTFAGRVAGTPGSGCSWFPILEAGPSGALHLATHDGAGGILVTTSTDGGATWTPSAAWGAGAIAAPWIEEASDGSLVVAWFEHHGKDATLHVTRGTPQEGPQSDAALGTKARGGNTRSSAGTDFAHFVLGDADAVQATWADLQEGRVYFAKEG